MADNVTVDNGTLTDYVVASDDVAIAGTQPAGEVQWVKLADGRVNGTDPIGGDAANGLDVDVTRVSGTVAVSGPVTDAQLRATPVPVSGTVTASGPLTDAQLRATPVPVSGTVATGGLTDAQLRAAVVPVGDGAGSLTVDAPIGTPLWVRESDGAAAFVGQKAMAASKPVVIASDQSSIPVTGPLTDAQLRASAVPISAASLPTHPVTNAGTFAVQDSEKVVDNAGFTDGTTKVLPTGYIFDEVAGTALTENDAGAARMDSKRAQIGVIEDATTRGQRAAVSAGGALSVDTEMPAAVALADGTSNPTVPGVSSFLMAWNGLSWDRIKGTLANGLDVRVTAGDINHDDVNTLKQIQVAGHASPVDLPPTVVSASGDRVRAWMDRSGAQVVRRRKIRESYTAVFRLAEAAARLDQTFTHVANTNKQWATLHHTATATKEIRLQLVVAWITSAITVAPQGILELRELSVTTPPATGNPAITGRPHRIGTGAHEATALYLPTTLGSEAAVNSPLGHHVFDEAVSVATVAMAHPQDYARGGITLYDAALEDDEVLQPTAPVGVYGGWAVVSRLTGASAMRLTVMMKWTEEIP